MGDLWERIRAANAKARTQERVTLRFTAVDLETLLTAHQRESSIEISNRLHEQLVKPLLEIRKRATPKNAWSLLKGLRLVEVDQKRLEMLFVAGCYAALTDQLHEGYPGVGWSRGESGIENRPGPEVFYIKDADSEPVLDEQLRERVLGALDAAERDGLDLRMVALRAVAAYLGRSDQAVRGYLERAREIVREEWRDLRAKLSEQVANEAFAHRNMEIPARHTIEKARGTGIPE